MDYQEFQRVKMEYNASILPHKIIQLDQLKHIGENVYNIQELDLIASPRVMNIYDRLILLTDAQLEKVHKTSGSTGVTNFRNYLAVASNIDKPQNVVVFADPDSRELVNIIPVKKAYISSVEFFNFVEMFVDQTKCQIEKIESSTYNDMGVTIYLNSHDPHVMSFCKGEDFITDGVFLRWVGNSVEMGSYFTRIVCTNGQTVNDRHLGSRIFELGSDNIRHLFKIFNEKRLQINCLERFKNSAMLAMNTQASLREMSLAQNILLNQAVDTSIVSELIPYNRNIEHFKERSFDPTHKETFFKSSHKVWELYNTLTEFATHTPIWEQDNIKRGAILDDAGAFLMTKRDIQHYVEYL